MSDDAAATAPPTGEDAGPQAPDAPAPQAGTAGADRPEAATPPAEGTDVPDGDDDGREAVSREELAKVIAQRQAAKARARLAERRLAELQAGANADPDAADADAAAEAPADAGETGEDLRAENARLREQLTRVLRDQGLRAAAAAAGAVNPDQVVALLRPRVRMDPGPDGRFVPTLLDEEGRPMDDGEGPAGGLETFVGLFLSLPENANLVRAEATGGSGARPAGGQALPERRPRSLAEFNALPEARRLQWALELGPDRLRTLLGLEDGSDPGFL